ncbi:MAG TPA: glutathione S-transferase N-terminal domain-containing protein [Usitatibacter sp.]|jgi:glutaredoxin|nr:glutathione S-transferase N-terminal domain-containing protein [Usitatibacter sp.]
MDAKLYHLEGCPYCRRVREFISQRGLEPFVEYHEVSGEPDALRRLVQRTGRMQVPVLEADGDPLVGSEVIIDWLDENAVCLSRGDPRAARGASGASAQRRAL